jgi:glycosyltransferase involved in cell wall biosynthesis
MIRVCHIVNNITGETDGVYKHLKMIFLNYDPSRFEHYLIFQGGEKVQKEVSELGVNVFLSEALGKRIFIKSFIDVFSILKKNNIDIIHSHLIKPYIVAGIVNVFCRKKFIFNYHGIFLAGNPYYSTIQKILYKILHVLIYICSRVDTVLVPSKKSKELLMNETSLFPEPVVYYNGYMNQKINRGINLTVKNKIQEIKKNKKIIALVGRLEIDKRIDMALKMFKKVNNKLQNTHLLIFGSGSLASKLKNIVEGLKLKNNIDFLGYVNEIEEYYKYFDLVLFTSDWEGMPLTMWEAMANEVPIVAPNVGGFKEILEENNCGLIYETGNIIEAEEKLLKLLVYNSLKSTLGTNGRMAIEFEYTEEKFIRQIEKVYSDLMTR